MHDVCICIITDCGSDVKRLMPNRVEDILDFADVGGKSSMQNPDFTATVRGVYVCDDAIAWRITPNTLTCGWGT
jgi:hypothetical protein